MYMGNHKLWNIDPNTKIFKLYNNNKPKPFI